MIYIFFFLSAVEIDNSLRGGLTTLRQDEESRRIRTKDNTLKNYAQLDLNIMDPSEGGDLERVFNICDTDGDGLLSKEELESILKDIGVENGDINEFMWGLQAEEYITYPQFVYAIEKFRLQSVNSGSNLSLHGSRVSPRSQAGSAAGGDHTECNFAIHDLNSKNSVLSKQLYSLEGQILELVQHTQDQEKNEKLQAKELRKLQGRFSSVSAELEVLKQINKDVSSRESDLKRQMKQLQDQKNNIDYDLQAARAQLEAARSGENALRNAMEMDAGIAHETQAEITRLADALERSEAEVQQLIKTNEELTKLRQEDEYQIKVLDARIERLNIEVEAKENLFAEIGLTPPAQVHDKLGSTWHGFRTVSPLFSELGHVDNGPAHPSLVDDRNLQIIGKNSLDSAFLKEKVANVNEEIRRRAPAVHRHPVGPVSSQSDEAGDSDTAFSSSLSENDKEPHESEKGSDDQNDLVTNQLMNLSDLVITTSDITHSECTTPTYHSTSSPNAEKDSSSTSPVPASDATVGTEDGDADREDGEDETESERESEKEQVNEKDQDTERDAKKVEVESLASPHTVERASTPTPSHIYGVSPDEAQHALRNKENESERNHEQMNGKTPTRRHSEDHAASAQEAQLQSGQTTPRSAPSTDRSANYATPYSYRSTPHSTPRRTEELTSSRSAPSTFRSEDQNTDTTPQRPIKHSKSEVIRTKMDKTPAKVEPITPAKTPNRRPELIRHKSEMSLYNSGLSCNPSPSAKMLEKVTADQANELHEFALRAGLLRPRPDFTQRLDKYAQVTPADLDESISRSRSQRNVISTPHSGHSNPQSTPKTGTSRSARTPHEMHHIDRKIVVRGHTYLVRLLSHPDPALDDLEDTVKKLEAELVGIEERFNKAASSTSTVTSSSSSSSSSSSTSTTTSTASVPATPPTKGARTPRTPVASTPVPSSPSSLSSSHQAFNNRRTLRPSPLVTSRSFKAESKFKKWIFWIVASLIVVLSLLLLAFIVSSKLQVNPAKVEL